MNQQENQAVDYQISEETEDQDFFQFADLELTDEQLAEVKGGPGSGWCSYCSVVYSNHNEVTVSDETEEAEDDLLQFADLSLSDEQLAEIKGGPGSGWCSHCTIIYSNHNETTVEDEDAETEAIEDLPVNDDQKEQVIGGGMINNKHPELTR